MKPKQLKPEKPASAKATVEDHRAYARGYQKEATKAARDEAKRLEQGGFFNPRKFSLWI
jgi:hypothetical protein